LGLFISKKIVEAHGGKIWAQNNCNENGATFYFNLPLIVIKSFSLTPKTKINTSLNPYLFTPLKMASNTKGYIGS
jgi:hypothetical protein